jgi:hypothetical protein
VKRRTVVVVALVVVLVATIWYAFAGHEAPAGQPPLAELSATTLQDLQKEFNQHADEMRVILLLSPT